MLSIDEADVMRERVLIPFIVPAFHPLVKDGTERETKVSLVPPSRSIGTALSVRV
jgi:hypothetical protein